MLKKVCCLSLYHASIVIGVFRFLVWGLLLVASIHVAVQIFSPDNGLVPYQARVDIERNSYVLFLIMLVTLGGLAMEGVLLRDLFQKKRSYMGLWYTLTILSFLLSIMLAVNFIFGILEIPSRPHTGQNFFFDALCVLFHIVFFFIPEYLFGPRLTPVLIAIMIIVHILLPVFHIFSFIVVKSHFNEERVNRYIEEMTAQNGIEEEVAPAIPQKCQLNLCQKCQLAAMENGTLSCAGSAYMKPYETTC